MGEGAATSPPPAKAERLFFGSYELRTDSCELLKEGARISLQPQPARLLELLARRSGEVVSREEIRRHLWGEDTFIEFEQGLNFSIRKIRIALEDSAAQPRFLETLPRRGYRFLVPVRVEPAALPSPAPEAVTGRVNDRRGARRILSRAAAGLALGLMLLATQPDRQPAGVDVIPGSERLSGAAFKAYTEGRFLAQRHGPGDHEKALALLEETMLLAPDFAPAFAEYAQLRLDFRSPPEEVVAPAETAARRALALAPCLNRARLVLANIGLYYRFDWRQARIELDRAVACDRRNSEVHRVYAGYLAARGQLAAAVATARKALLLDPRSEVALADLAWYSFLARRYEEALDLARRTLALEPRDTWTRQVLIEAALRTGKPEIALAAANELMDLIRSRGQPPLPPGPVEDLAPFWDWVWRRRTSAAAKVSLPPIDLAVPLLHLGQTERALRQIEESSRRKYGWTLAYLAVDPRFDALRNEPRFLRVLDSLGLR
jgi:DNA-binding winged helix-turn-helix (wHTH) protein/tetratricopeptide (TPR) repeat protein